MSQPVSLDDSTDFVALESSRVIHDLRAPLILAIAYLDEVIICRDDALSTLHTGTTDVISSDEKRELVNTLDGEMGLCITMMRDALEEIDAMMPRLRKHLR